MGGEEIEYVKEVFASNWIAPLGPCVDGFEQDLATYTGKNYAAALSAGTAAIHLALIILGIKQGDEVICSSFTFSGTVNPVVYQGAVPVFIDSEPETWNMDPVKLEEAIKAGIKKGKMPKAILLVHLYGMPAKLNEITEIAEKYNIPIIEDAAEALGSKYNGKPLGSFGIMSILSFNGNKIITTSGGGALLSDNEEFIKKARFLATQARDNAPHYQHSQIGYNYRMSNVVAAIGRGQMKVLNKRVERKREINAYYYSKIGNLPGISFLEEPSGAYSNHWLTCITVNPELSNGVTREKIRLALEEQNIESRPLWKPMHLQPVFEKYPYFGNGVAEKLFENGLCLPSGTAMNNEDIDRIIEIIKGVYNNN